MLAPCLLGVDAAHDIGAVLEGLGGMERAHLAREALHDDLRVPVDLEVGDGLVVKVGLDRVVADGAWCMVGGVNRRSEGSTL